MQHAFENVLPGRQIGGDRFEQSAVAPHLQAPRRSGLTAPQWILVLLLPCWWSDLRLVADEQQSLRDPRRAVEGLDAMEGLEATLFASEPMIRSLTNLDVDHRGRVWVCEVMNYRKHAGKRPEGDRILILEDRDGDGRADDAKVFYQGPDVDSAMGICVLGDRVVVSCSPRILVFRDTNGDDAADEKEVLFDQTGEPQNDHSAHAMVFGPDGRLYWNFGNAGKQVADREGRVVNDPIGRPVVDQRQPYIGGMTFRCLRDGSGLEVLAHNFRNPYEVAVDSFGNVWQSDNDDDGNRSVRINFIVEYGNYGYRDEMTGAGWRQTRTGIESELSERHWHQGDPGVVPNLLVTGAGSPSGITVYEGNLLPPLLQNQLIHCDAGPRVVRSYRVTKSGAGFKAETVDLLRGTRDEWFRPVDVAVAPDGSLFVADWYDPGVGGHDQADLDRGRIFRLAPRGVAYRVPSVDVAFPESAVSALTSPNSAARYLAWTALENMQRDAEPALRKLWQSRDPRLRARALWLLARLPGAGRRYVHEALTDACEDLRVVAVRIERQQNWPVNEMRDMAERLVRDGSPHVLREAAIALRDRPWPGCETTWAELARRCDGQDRWYLESLGIAAEGRWDESLQAWQQEIEGEALPEAVQAIIWRSRARQTPRRLAELVTREKDSERLARYMRAFDFQPSPEREEALEALALVHDETQSRQGWIAAEAIGRLPKFDPAASPHHAAALQRALDATAGGIDFVRLVGRFRVKDRYEDLLRLAEEQPRDEVGIEAARTLVAHGQIERIEARLRAGPPERAAALTEALGGAGVAEASALLIELVREPSLAADIRRAAVRAAATVRDPAQQLLRMTAEGRIDDDLRETVAAASLSFHWSDLRAEAQRLFPAPPDRDSTPLPPIEQLVSRRGDAARGAAVFRSTGQCAKCHVVGGEGQSVGPDLSEIGAKLDRRAQYESILFPSSGISHNYETHVLELAGGQVVSGILLSRSDDAVLLRTAEAQSRSIPLSEIERLEKQSISLMPADLHRGMTAEELVDLVEYLATLGKH
jgi:putative membrane-bound dehydrogenase-like protein